MCALRIPGSSTSGGLPSREDIWLPSSKMCLADFWMSRSLDFSLNQWTPYACEVQLWNDSTVLPFHPPASHLDEEGTVSPSVPPGSLSGLKTEPLIKGVIQGALKECRADLRVKYKYFKCVFSMRGWKLEARFAWQGQWDESLKQPEERNCKSILSNFFTMQPHLYWAAPTCDAQIITTKAPFKEKKNKKWRHVREQKISEALK